MKAAPTPNTITTTRTNTTTPIAASIVSRLSSPSVAVDGASDTSFADDVACVNSDDTCVDSKDTCVVVLTSEVATVVDGATDVSCVVEVTSVDVDVRTGRLNRLLLVGATSIDTNGEIAQYGLDSQSGLPILKIYVISQKLLKHTIIFSDN